MPIEKNTVSLNDSVVKVWPIQLSQGIKSCGLDIQPAPALTDFKGPTIFICYRRISVIANIEIKEKLRNGLKKSFCYRRISITGGSVRAGFNCMGVFCRVHATL